MTTIKSAFGKKLRVTDYDDGKLALTCAPDNDGSSDHVRVYDRAELLDALGAVATGTPYAEVVEQLHAATQRAEAAEATVQRVRDLDWCGYFSADYVRERIGKAIDPVPPFTLPTTVPARVEAKGSNNTRRTFYLWTNGAGGSNDLLWIDEDSWNHALTGAELMAKYTGHRLLRAEDA